MPRMRARHASDASVINPGRGGAAAGSAVSAATPSSPSADDGSALEEGAAAAAAAATAAGQALGAAGAAALAADVSTSVQFAAAAAGMGSYSTNDARFQVASSGKSHAAAKERVLKLFDVFRHSTDCRRRKYGTPFLQLSEVDACDKELYTDFTKFLMDEYKIESGEHKDNALSCDTILNYLGILVNQCHSQHGFSTNTHVR